jgi:Ca2+-dependent lipid-binding protein
VNDKVVVEKALSIKVFDHNDILSNTLIGTAVTSLKDIVQTARGTIYNLRI